MSAAVSSLPSTDPPLKSAPSTAGWSEVGTSLKYLSLKSGSLSRSYLRFLSKARTTVPTAAMAAKAPVPQTRMRARVRLAFASSAHCCSSERMESRRPAELCERPESQDCGKVTRISAYSSVPTPEAVKTTSLPEKLTLPSRGPCPQARTFCPAVTDSPAGTGRCSVQVTFWDSTSQPSETNFQ